MTATSWFDVLVHSETRRRLRTASKTLNEVTPVLGRERTAYSPVPSIRVVKPDAQELRPFFGDVAALHAAYPSGPRLWTERRATCRDKSTTIRGGKRERRSEGAASVPTGMPNRRRISVTATGCPNRQPLAASAVFRDALQTQINVAPPEHPDARLPLVVERPSPLPGEADADSPARPDQGPERNSAPCSLTSEPHAYGGMRARQDCVEPVPGSRDCGNLKDPLAGRF